jgi:TonB family protein
VRFSFAIIGKPAALAASVVVHVSALVAGGHALLASDASDSTFAQREVEIEIVAEAPPQPSATAETTFAEAARSATFPKHHHDYPVAPSHEDHPHDPALVHAPFAPTPVEAAPVETVRAETVPAVTAVFAMRVAGTAVVGATARGDANAAGLAGQGQGEPTYGEASVDAPARLVASAPPPYPESARRAEIEADVPVEIMIDSRGNVIESRALAHAGYGLDESAASAVKRYRFSAAVRGGRPVRVRMRWVVQFRLR